MVDSLAACDNATTFEEIGVRMPSNVMQGNPYVDYSTSIIEYNDIFSREFKKLAVLRKPTVTLAHMSKLMQIRARVIHDAMGPLG